MTSMKGKLLKKLKTITSTGYLKPDRILQVNASDGYIEALPRKSIEVPVQTQKFVYEEEEETNLVRERSLREQEHEIIDISELMRDLEDDEMESDDEINDKENIRPEIVDKTKGFSISISISSSEKGKREPRTGGAKIGPLSEIDVSNFRRPDLDSGSLFDPNLLAAFEQAVMEVRAQEAERRARIEEKNQEFIKEEDEEPPLKARKIDECRDLSLDSRDPLMDFEEKCPPGGSDSVILYTTGLRGILKTFENCNSIRFLLESFRVFYFERDISMHSEFREELWQIIGEKLVPPCLFIKGRYIGGAEQVLSLHEQGKLRPLLEGIPIDRSEGPCDGCGGIRFVVCFNCNGSHKVVYGEAMVPENCPECNENGLIICPVCC